MDWQRSILIGLLAVVSYLMILQWNKDYGPQQSKATEEISPQSYPQKDTPAISSQDVPVESNAHPVSGAEQSTISVNGLVRIETDVLDVTLNLAGGDIVSAKLKHYPVNIDQPDTPISLLTENKTHTYIAQNGLAGKDGPDASVSGRPTYVSTKPVYILEGDTLVVPLVYTQSNGAVVTKQFEFKRGSYLINTSIKVDNKGSQDWNGAYFGQIKRDRSEDPMNAGGSSFGTPTFIGYAYWSKEKKYNKYTFDEMEKSPLSEKAVPGGWLSLVQHYFMTAWIPDQESTFDYSTAIINHMYIARFVGGNVTIKPGESHNFNASFYVGPKIQKTLESIIPDKGLDLVVNYGPLFFISKFLFFILEKFESLVGNWGFAIILLTFTVKAAFFYPSAVSYRSMAQMRKIQPELMKLRDQYADDRQRLSQEMMKLYKDNKVNPLGGCLPILIQMPVFLALYWALLESVELRQAPFLGWIRDLSVMDPYFVLPLIMGVTMYIQQMLNPAPPDPMQAKMLKFMPVIFTVLFLWFPAGLVVYWITNNTLSIIQQWIITRKIEAEGIKRS